MSKELVISANRHETKVALIEDDQLVEVYFQRANEYSLAGSIHKGRVTRVLPGMQSAFVDLGLERDTFLYVSDFFEENEEYDMAGEPSERPDRQRDNGSRGRNEDRGGRGFDRPTRVEEPPPPIEAEPAEAPEAVIAEPPAPAEEVQEPAPAREPAPAPVESAPRTENRGPENRNEDAD